MDENEVIISTNENEDTILREPETNGQWLLRVLKPGGCVIVVIAAVLMVVFCFTKKPSLLKDYTPAYSSDDYISSPSLLAEELFEKVFPILPGEESCELLDGKVIIRIPHDEFLSSRAEILNCFPKDIIVFEDLG